MGEALYYYGIGLRYQNSVNETVLLDFYAPGCRS
jgi:hypothetical protein